MIHPTHCASRMEPAGTILCIRAQRTATDQTMINSALAALKIWLLFWRQSWIKWTENAIALFVSAKSLLRNPRLHLERRARALLNGSMMSVITGSTKVLTFMMGRFLGHLWRWFDGVFFLLVVSLSSGRHHIELVAGKFSRISWRFKDVSRVKIVWPKLSTYNVVLPVMDRKLHRGGMNGRYLPQMNV